LRRQVGGEEGDPAEPKKGNKQERMRGSWPGESKKGSTVEPVGRNTTKKNHRTRESVRERKENLGKKNAKKASHLRSSEMRKNRERKRKRMKMCDSEPGGGDFGTGKRRKQTHTLAAPANTKTREDSSGEDSGGSWIQARICRAN